MPIARRRLENTELFGRLAENFSRRVLKVELDKLLCSAGAEFLSFGSKYSVSIYLKRLDAEYAPTDWRNAVCDFGIWIPQRDRYLIIDDVGYWPLVIFRHHQQKIGFG